MPLFKPDEMEAKLCARAQGLQEIVLEADQRRAIDRAYEQVSVISGGPGVGKTTSVRILVEVLEGVACRTYSCRRRARPPSGSPKRRGGRRTPSTASCSASTVSVSSWRRALDRRGLLAG